MQHMIKRHFLPQNSVNPSFGITSIVAITFLVQPNLPLVSLGMSRGKRTQLTTPKQQ